MCYKINITGIATSDDLIYKLEQQLEILRSEKLAETLKLFQDHKLDFYAGYDPKYGGVKSEIQLIDPGKIPIQIGTKVETKNKTKGIVTGYYPETKNPFVVTINKSGMPCSSDYSENELTVI